MKSELKYIRVDQTPSTNTLLASLAGNAAHGTVVITRDQTAGRGQRGNRWESEPGMNITMSILLRVPEIKAREMFAVSEIVSVVIVEVLRRYIDPQKGEVAIKWPNDIYVGDKKICGILVENSIMGAHIDYSLAGIGLNVNQRIFLSDAPNPVSIYNLTNKEMNVDILADEVCCEILLLAECCKTPGFMASLHNRYKSMLWRREGFHLYAVPGGRRFKARINDVLTTGMLSLMDEQGLETLYAFKEVSAVI